MASHISAPFYYRSVFFFLTSLTSIFHVFWDTTWFALSFPVEFTSVLQLCLVFLLYGTSRVTYYLLSRGFTSLLLFYVMASIVACMLLLLRLSHPSLVCCLCSYIYRHFFILLPCSLRLLLRFIPATDHHLGMHIGQTPCSPTQFWDCYVVKHPMLDISSLL